MILTWMLPSPAWPNEAIVDPVLLLQPCGKIEKIDQPAARHADVLVELRQAGRLQRSGKFAAQIPEPLAIVLGRRHGHLERAARLQQLGQHLRLGADRLRLPVDLDQQVGVARRKMLRPKMPPRRLERETVGQLQRGGQKSLAKKDAARRPPPWRRQRTRLTARRARAEPGSAAA